MRLRRFSVQGYKNLEQPIVLDDLGPIEVIHGPNNVGKSNLLQAMALFFRCLAVGPARGIDIVQNEVPAELVHDLAPVPRALFHFERPLPIVLACEFLVQEREWTGAGFYDRLADAIVDIEITLQWHGPLAVARLTRFLCDGVDHLKDLASLKENVHPLARLIARNAAVSKGPEDRFALVGVRRGLEDTMITRTDDTAPLAQEMYDCRESTDRVQRDRWRAFVRGMEAFQCVTGKGTFEVIFPRSEHTASLVFDTEEMRIQLSLLGTGVQQVASVLGHALMRNASIVAIEEPELNLRWDLQNLLRDALAKLVSERSGTGGVDQIFIASHSATFESRDSFWLMEPGPKGPTLSRRPASQLPEVLGVAPRHLGLPEHAPQAYVTSQGVVQLPPHAIARLRLDKGGGVVFVDAEPRGVKILSDEDFLHELGLADDQGSSDAGR